MIETEFIRRIFGEDGDFSDYKYTSLLYACLLEMRKKTKLLLDRIPQDNPWITVHDISHVDALWEMLEVVLGEPSSWKDYSINPLEAFILGGAFLIHDAAMTLVALPNKVEEILISEQSKRIVRKHLQNVYKRLPNDKEVEQYDILKEGARDGILSRILRVTHAENAERLGVEEWTYCGESWRLIDNDEIRNDWGKLIGVIDRSHHYDVQDLIRLPKIDSVRSGYGVTWKVRPQFLACLLRCCDVIQIDHRRAPKFSTAFMNMKSESALHWDFQSRIRRIDGENEYIRIFSQEFPEEMADSWWTAYDMLSWAQKELDSVDTFIYEYGLPRLKRKRILGVESPETFSKYLLTDNWPVVRPEPKIGNDVEIIKNLGGWQLYGNYHQTPLRELLMNAFDATHTRCEIDRYFNLENCRIRIEVESVRDKDGDRDIYIIRVIDNGIGMDRYIMSSVLLDFGRSFWRKYENLEIHCAKHFNPTGEFGIGFFSIFMWSNEISVISKLYNSTSEYDELKFTHGLESRPKFKKCFRTNLPRWANTCIEFKIEKLVFDEYISIPSPNIEFRSSFTQNAIFNSLNGVSPLTATTIELFVNGKELVINGIDIEKSSPYLIQKRLRFNNQIVVKKTNTDEITPGSLIVHSQPIYRDGVCVGRGFPAQIITGKGNLRSAVIVNGFPTESPVVDFAGVVEGRPCEASRNKYLPSIKEHEWKEWFVRCKNTVDLGKINSYAWARWAVRLNEYPGNVPIFYDFKGTKIRLSDLDILRDCESIYVVDRFRSDSQFLETHYAHHICTKELNIKITDSAFILWLKKALEQFFGAELKIEVSISELIVPKNVNKKGNLGKAETIFECVRNTKSPYRRDILSKHNKKYPIFNKTEYVYEGNIERALQLKIVA